MSVQAIGWALTQELPTATKFVLVALCNYADEDGRCWPSQERLAADTAMTERTVRTHLKRLEDKKIIARKARWKEKGSRASDVIWIHMEANRKEMPVSPTIPETDDNHTGNSRPTIPERDSGEPSLEPSIEPSEVLCAGSAPQTLPETNRKTYPETFEAFWSPLQATKAYHGTPLGTKAEAFNEWQRHAKHIPPDDLRLQWMAYLTQCRRSDTNTKHVCRWLKYHGFENDYGEQMTGADQVKAALAEKWRREDERDEAGNLRTGDRTPEGRLLTASQS